jgi:predicted NACHT family NTPase
LIQELTNHYTGPDWGFKRGEAQRAARGFLDNVHHYSNILVERGQKQYGFLHLTFEEMLAAYGIYQRGQLDWKESLALIKVI